jgi:hypothetical protein
MQHTHVYFVDRDRSGLRADQPLSFLHILYCAKWRIRSWGGAVCLPLQAQVASSVLLRCLQFLFFFSARVIHPTPSSRGSRMRRLRYSKHDFALRPDGCCPPDATAPGDALVALSGVVTCELCSNASFEFGAGSVYHAARPPNDRRGKTRRLAIVSADPSM